jgi:hypothetical protein
MKKGDNVDDADDDGEVKTSASQNHAIAMKTSASRNHATPTATLCTCFTTTRTDPRN